MNNLAFQIYGSTKSGIFQSTWKTDNISTGSSASNQITLPLISGGTYNFWIDWGDGSTTNVTSYSQIYSGETLPRTHTYTTAGIYTVRITGTIIGFGFNLTGDRLKITSILSWGKLRLGTGSVLTFYNCDNLNLNNVSDILDLTGTTSLYGFIFGNKVTTTINRINEWDFSSVTNMENSFGGTLLFNQPLSFNSVNVTNMSGLFAGTKAFNSDVTINASKVINMYNMFGGALVFNKPLSFDTSKVTNMSSMFYGATAFNSALNFDTSLVTTMSQMFRGASLFNQNIGNWNVSNVTSFFQMFIEDFAFNNEGSDSIKNWQINTLSSVDMSSMFAYAYAFNQPIGLWNTSKVNSMSNMFFYDSAFNQPIGSWDVSKVTNMAYMFVGCTSFNNGYASGVANQLPWNTSACINMASMFAYCPAFNSNLGTGTTPWDVSKVTTFSSMFQGAANFNNGDDLAPINNWSINTVSSVIMFGMFNNTSVFNRNISAWNVTKVNTMEQMFAYASVFNQSLSNWERIGSTLVNITNMTNMFLSCPSFNQSIGNWNVSSVTNFVNFMYNKTPATFSSTNLDAIYNGWIVNGVKPNINISFGTAKYSQAGKPGKDTLLASPNNWTITDGLLNVSGTSNNGGLIRVTTSAVHGFTTGNSVYIYGVNGTTNANGTWTITVVSTTVIELQGSTYNAAWTSGGNVILG